MTTLLILLSPCTLICSDSALVHFEALDTNNNNNAAFSPYPAHHMIVHKITGEAKTPKDSLFDGSVKSCAEQCLLMKFFCKSFLVTSVFGEHHCSMSPYKELWPSKFQKVGTKNLPLELIEGAFSIKKNVDNVAEILRGPLLRKDKFDELLQGYGFSKSLNEDRWNNMRTLLMASLTALDIPKTTSNNFINWINGVKSSGSESKYTHSGKPSRKRTKLNNTLESNILTNIELFIRGVNPNADTVYDRENKVLFIGSPEHQLLFNATIDNALFWTVSGKDFRSFIIRVSTGQLNAEQIPWEAVRELHMKAAARYHHVANNLWPQVLENRSFWRPICQLTGPWDCKSDNQVLLVRNLVTVVSVLHDKPKMMYTERVQTSFPGELVDIITQSE